jgi:hypothetical protein
VRCRLSRLRTTRYKRASRRWRPPITEPIDWEAFLAEARAAFLKDPGYSTKMMEGRLALLRKKERQKERYRRLKSQREG